MIDELIVDIKQSEAKAEEIVRSSLAKAKEIISQAKSEAEQIAIKGDAELRALNDGIVKSANAAADEKYAEIIAGASNIANEFKSIGEKNKKEALKLIVDKVLG